MKIKNMCRSFLILMSIFSAVFANNGVSLTPVELNEFGHNLRTTKEINLTTINKSFKKELSKHLNKCERERSIFVKKTKLKVPFAKFKFVETGNENKYATYNQSLTDVIGKNAKNTIAEISLEELGLGAETINQSLTLNGNFKFTSVKFDSSKLTFKLSPYKNKEH